MSSKMLIDARHPEETRVAVVRGHRIEEFDYEAAAKRQLKGNIYLARVTRVEPSLQAAFVEYGGNRHGFLAFSEIHPDYYQIPIADRERLLKEEAESMARDHDDDHEDDADEGGAKAQAGENGNGDDAEASEDGEQSEAAAASEPDPEHSLEDVDEVVEKRRKRYRRRYKIQEVIKRRQVLLIQVVKEERGTKGAALTTYLSLAGRYCVLMPNSTHGGGISRKIASGADRKRLKSIMSDLDVPDGMGCIIRTAGMKRTKTEIKRDYDYLIRLWEEIRERTLGSVAPALIYEEGDLIKRSIRDLYSREIDEVHVEGEEGYKSAKNFMRMLMPSHAKKVQLYKDRIPLFQRYKVEAQLDTMYQPIVQLRSGGYIVINPTEALVSIDVNSGKATREHNIEETALNTNCEAAEELARQLRLRDLAGLIVIDFIDMEDRGNIKQVERKLRDALKTDRARVQIGRISSFGLLEMSRQRLRPGVLEASTNVCPTCRGAGTVRSVGSSSLHAIRVLEEEGLRGRASHVTMKLAPDVAIYLLNHKRDTLHDLESHYGYRIEIMPDADIISPDYELTHSGPPPSAVKAESEEQALSLDGAMSSDERETAAESRALENRAEDGLDEEKPSKRRRRRRRRGRKRDDENASQTEDAAPAAELEEAEDGDEPDNLAASEQAGEDQPKKRRRRRGGRGRRSRNGEAEAGTEAQASSQADETVETVETAETPAELETAPEITAEPAEALAAPDAAEAKAEAAETQSETAEDAEDAPKKKRRTRKTTAKTAAKKETPARPRKPRAKKAAKDANSAETPAADAEDPAKTAEERNGKAEDVEAPSSAPAPALAAEPTEAFAEAEQEENGGGKPDSQSPRRGWWQRAFQRP